jgi:hypothetical protein
VAYGLRHSYITRMLEAGCPIKVLADLCGTSAAMIERNYSHLHADLEALHRLFERFSGRISGPPAPGLGVEQAAVVAGARRGRGGHRRQVRLPPFPQEGLQVLLGDQELPAQPGRTELAAVQQAIDQAVADG